MPVTNLFSDPFVEICYGPTINAPRSAYVQGWAWLDLAQYGGVWGTNSGGSDTFKMCT